MDWGLFLPIASVLCGGVGLNFVTIASVDYFRLERDAVESNVRVGIGLLLLQYLLISYAIRVWRDPLLPIFLVFLVLMALSMAVRVGYKAKTKAGNRVAVSGLCTALCYAFAFAFEYHQVHYWWR